MLFPVSEWYSSIGNYTFPTMFIRLRPAEIDALLGAERYAPVAREVIQRLDYVIDHLPGLCFVHADVCAPSDTALFRQTDGAAHDGGTAWSMLMESEKVRAAFRERLTCRVAFHPYRRMDHNREFRMFVKGRQLKAMSQRFLTRHLPNLVAREQDIWGLGQSLVANIGEFLPADDVTMDVYLTATGRLMVLDLNPFGPPTNPLLLRNWEQDWSKELGLKLLPRPIQLRGDVSVSF